MRRFILALGVAVAGLLALVHPIMRAQQPQVQGDTVLLQPPMEAPDQPNGVQISASSAATVVAVVNFAELAEREALNPPSVQLASESVIPFNRLVETDTSESVSPIREQPSLLDEFRSSLPSPSPLKSYQGLDDIPADGFSKIPPDTHGAVGLDRVFTTLNNHYRVLDKATGSTINTVSINTFWASTGASGPFDPKTLYDPYNNRFIVTAVSNAASSTSSILIGISATSDPNGTWTLFRLQPCAIFPCGAGTDWWADFPSIGFNKNWVAVSVNMFGNADNIFKESRLLVANYPNLRGGNQSGSMFFALPDFTIQPAVTYSSTEETLYAPIHGSSSGRSYRLSTITGTAAAPVYTRGTLQTHSVLSAWASPVANSGPQIPEPGTGVTAGIDVGDERLTNAVFRNGHTWYAQTVGLPAGTPTHTAAQWVKLNTSGAVVDGGRVEDATATATNGGKWYAYPSITVNKYNDVLLGFSQFSSNQFPSAAYALRSGGDPAGTMRDPVISKAGAGFYWKTFSGADNRWGDYSNTQVDPIDDASMWTIQEYSQAQVGTGNGSGRWSTWWIQTRIARTGATDTDGDGRADLAIFRPSNGTWFIGNSTTGYTTSTVRQWGLSTDVPASGDYDADGKTDLAVYRPSDGGWYILHSSTNASATYTLGVSGDLPVPGDYDGDGRTDPAVYRRSTGVWYVLTSSAGYTAAVTRQWGQPGDIPVPGDYDGDGKADLTVYRPSTGTWYVLTSTSGQTAGREFQWGFSGDVPVPGDYDGDLKTDVAVYRPATGVWFLLRSTSDFTTSVSHQWGLAADIPVPSDYDGDGKTDLAVYRPGDGTWYIAQSTSSYTTSVSFQWGLSGDVPAPNAPLAHALATQSTLATLVRVSDFDADRKADLTVYRPSTSTWFTLRSSTNFGTSASYQFGLTGDLPMPHDYDGDGQTDVTVYRPATGVWYILQSTTNFTTSVSRQWGISGDLPVPGDYDGDRKTDAAVYRPATGVWYILQSSTGYTTSSEFQWGLNGDVTVPGDYDGDTLTDLAVYRPSTGEWFIRQSSTGYATSTSFQWGLAGDITVPGDYDGDGKTDIAVYRPSTGEWFIRQSSTGYATSVSFQWGLGGDVPVPSDFDGDAKTDLAVFRPSTGVWYLLKSSTNFTTAATYQWGLSGDIPILKRP